MGASPLRAGQEVCSRTPAKTETDPKPVLTTRPAPESQSPAVQATPLRTPSQKATQLALDIAAWLGGCQTEDLAILDISGPLAIVDYFVVGTVRNTRQA